MNNASQTSCVTTAPCCAATTPCCVATTPSSSHIRTEPSSFHDAGGGVATQHDAGISTGEAAAKRSLEWCGVATQRVARKLVASILIALCAVALNAAQCEGLTKAGVRCKREAATDSKYCLGHADQAKALKVEKLKDDGTCWAVTEKGARCKHKKDGESDYCKQHAADKKPTKPVKQCRALKWDGQRCERAPQADSYYCKQHAKLGARAESKSEPKTSVEATTQATPKASGKKKQASSSAK